MAAARIDAARAFLAALTAPAERAQPRLQSLLHPQAKFMTLGKGAQGAQAVAELLASAPNGELARKLQWQEPLAVDDKVRLTGERRPGTMDRGLVVTLGFEGDAIALVQQQRTPPPQATPIVLPETLKAMVDHALVERHPMLVAYCDPQGQPVLSFRGSVQAWSDDQLALWIRSADGAFIQAIRKNPKLALVYRNEESKATYNFQGRARVTALAADRQRVFDAAPQAEREHDFAMLGVAVIVDLDRVEGYSGLGPGGQVGQIRMLRDAAAQ
ncbi:pyridoxamine 5'-phosphate oxidase family protein [Caenimonas terrae]|uniref:Pyridoxamine 5'-phosphate oxidase family protein n=1 Tax=Caenimonas terrae TaxID=696074 RepID=A0ABW0NA49_9BURK